MVKKAIICVFLFIESLAFAETLNCQKGGSIAKVDYEKAVNFLSSGEKLTSNEQIEIVHLLQTAVSNRCQKAALVLAERKIIELGANQGKDPSLVRALDTEIHSLLIESTQLNEGWFELGIFLATKDSVYYSLKLSKKMLEKAAAQGDMRAIDFLIDAYTNGRDGIEINVKRADYWRRFKK